MGDCICDSLRHGDFHTKSCRSRLAICRLIVFPVLYRCKPCADGEVFPENGSFNIHCVYSVQADEDCIAGRICKKYGGGDNGKGHKLRHGFGRGFHPFAGDFRRGNRRIHMAGRLQILSHPALRCASAYRRNSEQNKKKIQKLADNENKTVTEYILDTVLKQRNITNNSVKLNVYVAAVTQDICNYIKENYGKDKFLDEEVERLWELL